MRRCTRPAVAALALVLALGLSVGVATATAAQGGNSTNAKLCQKGGWMNFQGSDGTQFTSDGDCVSFGAHGGMIVPEGCLAGREDFSEDALGSQPTRFSGGTIDTPYTLVDPPGGIYLTNEAWAFPTGTFLLYPGVTEGPFRLTFTNAVKSVQLDAASVGDPVATETLRAYDSSGVAIGADLFTGGGVEPTPFGTVKVSSTTNDIKYFTVEGTYAQGFVFTNIVWDCA